jgi:hypothetical protein
LNYGERDKRIMSKIKQQLEREIVISDTSLEITAWNRYICFQYEGNQYELTLFWNEFDGFDIWWREPSKAPDWAINWDETKYNGESLAGYLDWLTYSREKESE